jgi:hypothetical protein
MDRVEGVTLLFRGRRLSEEEERITLEQLMRRVSSLLGAGGTDGSLRLVRRRMSWSFIVLFTRMCYTDFNDNKYLSQG